MYYILFFAVVLGCIVHVTVEMKTTDIVVHDEA